MHIHIVIDVDWWSFAMHADAMKRALEKRGHEVVVGCIPWDTTGLSPEEAVERCPPHIISFVGLMDRCGGIPPSAQYVGIRSHSSLRGLGVPEVQRLRQVAGVFAVNRRLAQEAADKLERDVFYLPDGIDTERYTLKRRCRDAEFVLGWSGNAGLPEKRYHWAEEIAAKAGVKLRAVGRGLDLEQLPLEAMPDFFRKISAYVCTSSEDGGPNGPLEAAACGTPVLSTRCGAMPEFCYGSMLFDRPLEAAVIVRRLKGLRENHDTGQWAMEVDTHRQLAEEWSWDNQIRNYLAMMGDREWMLRRRSTIGPVQPAVQKSPKKKAVIALMMDLSHEAGLDSAHWRLFQTSPKFDWQLVPQKPFASVGMMRSLLVSNCLRRTEAEVIVLQDGDMGVELDDYDFIASEALARDAVIGSLLCKRGGNGLCNHIDLGKRVKGRIRLGSETTIELLPGEYNGAALAAYPRTVLERMAARLPWCVPHGVKLDDHAGMEALGFWPFFHAELEDAETKYCHPLSNGEVIVHVLENRAFCDLARALDEKQFCSLRPRVAHWGSYPWYPEDAGKVL